MAVTSYVQKRNAKKSCDSMTNVCLTNMDLVLLLSNCKNLLALSASVDYLFKQPYKKGIDQI